MALRQGYTLDNLYKRAGINRSELAELIGVQPNTVYKWKTTPPAVRLYLELLIEVNECRDFKESLKRMMR